LVKKVEATPVEVSAEQAIPVEDPDVQAITVEDPDVQAIPVEDPEAQARVKPKRSQRLMAQKNKEQTTPLAYKLGMCHLTQML
jgi:hypothetical protein